MTRLDVTSKNSLLVEASLKRLRGLMLFPILALAFCASAPEAPSQASRQIQFDSSENSARVFVEDAHVKAATDSNGVAHAAGVRRATDDDDGASNVMASDGSSLLVSLDKWRSAEGTATITPTDGGSDRVKVSFKHLIAFGEYSMFVVDLTDPDASALRALDGDGSRNSFQAAVDGTATLTVTTDKQLTQGEAIALIYHSDDTEHGPSPGQLFIDAHQQLIARV